jgi:RNA polymerase sigma-70 factor (sigma-E family)
VTIASGDDFRDFVASQGPGLLRFARWLTDGPEDAEDLLQTALGKTFARWRSVRDDPVRYVRSAMINKQRDGRRRLGVFRALPVEVRREAVEDLDLLSEREELRLALRALSTRERLVVVLKHYYDLSEQDIARELGIAPGTVKSANARALGKLRALIHRPTATEVEP